MCLCMCVFVPKIIIIFSHDPPQTTHLQDLLLSLVEYLYRGQYLKVHQEKPLSLSLVVITQPSLSRNTSESSIATGVEFAQFFSTLTLIPITAHHVQCVKYDYSNYPTKLGNLFNIY